MHMLRRHGFDYLLVGDFGQLEANDTPFRKVLEASILATDMSRHFSFVNEINEMGRRFGERRASTPGAPSTLESDRLLLCSGLMKCADISNPVSHFYSHSRSILIEFFRHDRIESRELGRLHYSMNGLLKR